MSGDAVLHVIPSVSRRDGGPSAAVLGMCRALIAAGCPAEIVTTDADGAGRLPVTRGAQVDHDGVPTTFFARVVDGGLKWSPGLARWLGRHVHRYRLVHIHAVFSHAPIAASSACRRAGVPYIVRPLGTLDPWSVRRKAARKRLLWHAGVNRLLSDAAAMHYTTAEEGRLAEQAMGALPQGIVIPVGVDDEWFGLAGASRPAALRILSLSRLDPKKRIEALIAAFHAIADEPGADRWTLTIAGDGAPEYVATLQDLARRGRGGKRIEFPGWVSGAEKRRLFATSSVFVLPSIQENFGIAVAEAMAAGIPVVVSTHVNLSPDIRRADAGWVLDEAGTNLAGALRDAMRDEAERERRGANATRLAEGFRWHAIAEALRVAYDAIVNGSHTVLLPAMSPADARSVSRH